MDPAFFSIAELSRLYDSRALSPVEVTRAMLDRIARYDVGLHSFIRVTPEIALAEAAEAERELIAGRRRGPMHGIPYALKDVIETSGIATTGHSKLCQDHVPDADAHLVTRLKEGGAVLMGKLASWEFALGGPSWDLPWPAGPQSLEPRLPARRFIKRCRSRCSGGVCRRGCWHGYGRLDPGSSGIVWNLRA